MPGGLGSTCRRREHPRQAGGQGRALAADAAWAYAWTPRAGRARTVGMSKTVVRAGARGADRWQVSVGPRNYVAGSRMRA